MMKNSKENLTVGKLLGVFLPMFLCLLVIRFVEVARGIDAATGFFKVQSPLHGLFYAFVIACGAVLIIGSFLSKPAGGIRTIGFRSPWLCVMSVLTALAFLLDSYGAFRQHAAIGTVGVTFREKMSSGALPLTLQGVFALLSAAYFIVLAISYKKGSLLAKKARILALSPICWAAFRMIRHFVRKISFVKVSDLFFEILMLGCMMLFFMAFASVTSGIYSDGTAWRITGYGLPAALLAGMLSLPRMVFTLIDKAAYINENHPLNPVDCLFFCFVLLLCVTAARLPQTAQPQEAPAA